jgi:hypothetical protein
MLSVLLLLLAQDYGAWKEYSGGAHSSQYSSLKPIHRGNQHQLKPVWNYRIVQNKKYYFNPVVMRSSQSWNSNWKSSPV